MVLSCTKKKDVRRLTDHTQYNRIKIINEEMKERKNKEKKDKAAFTFGCKIESMRSSGRYLLRI